MNPPAKLSASSAEAEETPPDFSHLSLSEISSHLQETAHRLDAEETTAFLILDPDLCIGRYAGEEIVRNGRRYLCRSWHSWSTLAALLGYRMLTPHPFDTHRLLLRFQKLKTDRSFHREGSDKYDGGGHFSKIRKNEEPAFFHYYRQALKRLDIGNRVKILDLGIHTAEELQPVADLAAENFPKMRIVGVDLSENALLEAQSRYPRNLTTYRHDINDLTSLDLGRFDLILSIGTLQSPGIEMKPLIMNLVQKHLTPDGTLLLGWPNARWCDGELLYGARPKHYPFSELSLVIKDLFWIKKYLQQHKFRVVITGREYLFLEATRIGVRS